MEDNSKKENAKGSHVAQIILVIIVGGAILFWVASSIGTNAPQSPSAQPQQNTQPTSQPITESNDQVCQNQYGASSDYTGKSNSQGGPICGCESGYQWNSNQTACVRAKTGYQVCGDTYPNETWDGTYGSDGTYNCVCDSGFVMNSTKTGCVAYYAPMTFPPNVETNRSSYVSNCTSAGATPNYCNCTFDYLISNYGLIWLIEANANYNVSGVIPPQFHSAQQYCSAWDN
jgi:hypothetical protein